MEMGVLSICWGSGGSVSFRQVVVAAVPLSVLRNRHRRMAIR